MVAPAVLLRGAGATTLTAPPIILERTEQEFVPALLSELGDAGGLDTALTTKTTPREAGGVASLYQPIHRVFHLALLEVVCSEPGQPRIDPKRIVEAGLVVRRVGVDGEGRLLPDTLEAWVEESPTERSRGTGAPTRRIRRGWVRFDGELGQPNGDLDRDPDPARRPAELKTGHPELDRMFALRGPSVALRESVAPLFKAGPDVEGATGKTLLYGLVPVTSSELADLSETLPPYEPKDIEDHLPNILRAGLTASLPDAGRNLQASKLFQFPLDTVRDRFIKELRQVVVQLDAFGTDAHSMAVKVELDRMSVELLDEAVWPEWKVSEGIAAWTAWHRLGRPAAQRPPGVVARPLGDWMADAVAVFFEGDDLSAHVRMPLRWPTVPAERQAGIARAAQASMAARLGTTMRKPGRFEDPLRQYRLRAFIRVRGDGGCEDRLVWSDHSEPFSIAPWYEPGDQPPPLIQLPDALDRAALKSLKPNVAFSVPPKLMSFLDRNDPSDLMEGDGDEGNGLGLGFICSLSLPIITLCAFIVLMIFLSLFDLIFRWLLYIKVCLPVPKPR